jgi:hypothetical protein
MLDELASLDVLLRDLPDTEAYLTALSRCISDVSALGVRHPEVAEVDARRLVMGLGSTGELTSADITLIVTDVPAIREPTARRM